jgi:anti-sigma B factor antagonist
MPQPTSVGPQHGRWRPFHCEARHDGDRLRLVIAGEFDLESSTIVRATLHEHLRDDVRSVVVDLGDVTFMDSSGLHVVIDEGRAAVARGVAFAIAPGPPPVQRIFSITGTADLFPAADRR